AQEGLSSASAKYGRIKKLESVALSEWFLHILLIVHITMNETRLTISGEDHPNDDMTGAVNPSMDSNSIVNNIGPDNTNQCDTAATIEGCS
ncbi:hypothetical protein HID58_092456, partial [Brassica napus]